jgi:hypothetical protein
MITKEEKRIVAFYGLHNSIKVLRHWKISGGKYSSLQSLILALNGRWLCKR